MSRVLMTAARCFPKLGGVERHVEAVRLELQAAGYDVHVVELGEGLSAVRSLPKLVRIMRSRTFDVVHAHDFLPAFVTWVACSMAGAHRKLYATIHGYESFPLRPAFIAGHRLAHRLANKVLAVGAYIDAWYGTRSTLVVHGGVSRVSSVSTPLPRRVVFISRLDTDTNCLQIARGFIAAAKRHADVEFEIYGFGPLSDAVGGACTGTPVRFLGPLQDVEPVIASAGIVVANSYLAILEAFALGKPVVSYYGNALKFDYLSEIANASSGLILAGNSGELTQALDSLLGHPLHADALANRGRAYASRLLWQNVAADYTALWNI